MIRINLLPDRQTQKRQTIQQQLLGALGAVIIVVLGCIFWVAVVSGEVDERRKGIKERQEEMRQLDKIIGEVNEFNTKKEELKSKLEIIEKLRKGKTGPVRALDDLATEIPNRVWLTKMTEKNGSVVLEGLAVDPEDVSAFMKSLQKSKYFSGITLHSTEDVNKGAVLYKFRITCAVSYAA